MSSGDDGQASVAVNATAASLVDTSGIEQGTNPVLPVVTNGNRPVPIKGYNASRGYPRPSIMPQLSVADANNLILVTKLRATSSHEFNYSQPNAVRYFADRSADQNSIASAYITLLAQQGIYGVHGMGKSPTYTISYDEDTRSLIFLAEDSNTAETMVNVAKQVQALVGGKEDRSISFQTNGHVRYDSNVAADMVDFRKPTKPVAYEKVTGTMPAIIVRLKALGIAPNEETTEGKSTIEKLGHKIEEWGAGAPDSEAAGEGIFRQYWAKMLAMIAHVPEGPGGANIRSSRKQELIKAGYGDASSELIMNGFPKPMFDRLVREVGVAIQREPRTAHVVGKINAYCIGEFITPLIKDGLDKGVFLTADSIVNHGEHADQNRGALDIEALDAAIRTEVARTKAISRQDLYPR